MIENPIYITKEGLERVQKELRELRTIRRKEVADRIEKAKELGDLSENAEYAEAKDEMSFVEGRILELQNTVNRSITIEKQRETNAVMIGSTVVIQTNGKEKTYTVVGSNEADPLHGRISNETPLAQALLGKCVGDAIEVKVPAGKILYTILSIK